MEYVSPEYKKQLDDLAEKLCTPDRFGRVAVAQSVQLELDIPETVVLGEE